MSAFLGPIHHWLFNKITLFENLEKNINNEIISKYEDKAQNITNEINRKYEEFIPDEPLENLIDTQNIHGWLQNRISIAETRHAETIKTFMDNFGNEVIDIIEKSYIQQGSQIGIKASKEVNVSDAPSLYEALNNYLLEGMPCDNVNSIMTSQEQLLKWNTSSCLHKHYWDKANANSEIMYKLRFSWIKSFVENANPNYTYKNSADSQGFIHQILQK